MKTRLIIIIGIILIIGTVVTIDIYQNKLEWDKVIQEDAVVSTNKEPSVIPEPEPEKISEFSKLPRNEKRVIIEGEMADQICSIIDGECPSYYIGNIQEDGSVMVGITISNTVKEKQFIFFIKNNTLSYEIKENEN